MSTSDYKKGLEGKEPGFLKEFFDKEGYMDQKQGYRDFLRNVDLASRIKNQKVEHNYNYNDAGGAYTAEHYSFKFNLCMWGIFFSPIGVMGLIAMLGGGLAEGLMCLGFWIFLVLVFALSSWSSQPPRNNKK